MQSFNRYRASCCPIHNGDNPTALTIYTENEPYGHWQCNTQGCHKHFVRNAIGFIRGVLSGRNGWTTNNRQKVSFNDTVEVCRGLVGHTDISSLATKSRILSEYRPKKEIPTGISRDVIRKRLNIPAEYFTRPENGGFKPETLNLFDVGEPISPKPEMYGRVIIPIYDERYLYIGCQGRDTGNNPIRWKNSENLPLESILYNIHLARPYIKDSKKIILVESPKSVWRLWENNIRNVVATLGGFKNGQKILLEMSGASTLMPMMDRDDAGRGFFETINKKCKKLFHIKEIIYGKESQDPSDLSNEEILNLSINTL